MQELTTKQRATELNNMLTQNQEQIAAVLPKDIDVGKFTKVVYMACRNMPKLFECDPGTVVMAALQAASLGLLPEPALGQCYILPYGKRAQFLLGYRGMLRLARNSGLVKSIDADVVREDDDFSYRKGTDKYLHHVPSLDGDGTEPIRCVYAVVEYTNGGRDFCVMRVHEINRIMDRSPSARRGDSPWKTDFVPMACKTAIRKLFKFMPTSDSMDRGITLDEQADAGLDQTFDQRVIEAVQEADNPEHVEHTEQQSTLDRVAADLQQSSDRSGSDVVAEGGPPIEDAQIDEDEADEQEAVSMEFISEKQRRLLWKRLRARAWDDKTTQAFKKSMCAWYEVDSTTKLPASRMDEMLNWIDNIDDPSGIMPMHTRILELLIHMFCDEQPRMNDEPPLDEQELYAQVLAFAGVDDKEDLSITAACEAKALYRKQIQEIRDAA